MRLRLKHLLVALVVLLCSAFAYSPLLRSGLLIHDYAALVQAHAPADRADAPPTTDGPLARATLRASSQLYGLVPMGDVARGSRLAGSLLRAENLLLLLLAGAGLAGFLRRLLLPWMGNEAARSAGRAAGLLLLLHPLSVLAVANLSSRGALLAAALGMGSALCFLRGRQDRLALSAVLSMLLAVAAGFASDLALGLGPLLCLAELLSSRRYRPLRTRLRTGLTTLVLFGAATCGERLRLLITESGDPWPPMVRALVADQADGRLAASALHLVEKLGLLVLPVNTMVLGLAGVVVAGALFLMATQPALWAARSAPRLWGWFLASWFVALLFSELLHVHVRVSPEEYWRTRELFPSVLVLAAGLGVASTALSSPRRPYLTWVVAVGLAAVAHGNVRPWPAASHSLDELRGDLLGTRVAVGSVPIWLIDPPAAEPGLEPSVGRLDVLIHPALLGAGGSATGTSGTPAVRGIHERGFLALVGQPELDERVSEGLALLFPSELVAPESTEDRGGGRMHRVLVSQGPSSGARSWSGTVSSPTLDLSTWSDSALRVTLPASSDRSEFEYVSWLSRNTGPPERGRVRGLWRSSGGDQVGVFDLGGAFSWRLGGRVRRLLFEEGSSSIRRAEIWSALPTLEVSGPTVERAGDGVRGASTWSFRIDTPPPFEAGVYRLELVDTRSLAWSEHEPEAGERGPGQVLSFAQGLPILVEPAGEAEGEPAATGRWLWVLEYRIDGHAVARSRGRL